MDDCRPHRVLTYSVPRTKGHGEEVEMAWSVYGPCQREAKGIYNIILGSIIMPTEGHGVDDDPAHLSLRIAGCSGTDGPKEEEDNSGSPSHCMARTGAPKEFLGT